MRWKITLILLLLNIITFYGIYHLNYFRKAISKKESENILGIAVVDIDKIEIINKSLKEPRILERTNGQWKIISPIEWPANLFAVQRIITQIQFLIHEARFSIKEIENSGQSLDDYGLKDPNIILKFRSTNGEHSIAIGNTTSLGKRIYIMDPKRENILVVKESLLDSISGNLEDLRTQQIFTIPFFDLNKLNIQLFSPSNLKIQLSKTKDSWEFNAPIHTKANDVLVNNSINQLTGITAQRIIFGEELEIAKNSLRNPKIKISLEGNKHKQTLLLGEKYLMVSDKKLYYAQLENNNTIFTVLSDPLDSLTDAQEALRDKRIITIDTNTLKNIKLEESRKKLELQKLEIDRWQLIASDARGHPLRETADNQVLEILKKRLKNLEVITFVSDAPSSLDLEKFGLSEPQRTIEIVGEGAQKLLIGNLDNATGKLYAKLENQPFVYQITPDAISFFSVNELLYKERLLEKLPSAAIIQSIKIVDLLNNKPIFERGIANEQDNWENVLADLTENKKNAIHEILESLRAFRVKNFLPHKFTHEVTLDSETKLPWAYKLEAKILLPGGDTTKVENLEYVFTKRLSGNLQIGGSSKKDLVFSIEQNWIDYLFAFYNQN